MHPTRKAASSAQALDACDDGRSVYAGSELSEKRILIEKLRVNIKLLLSCYKSNFAVL